MEDSNEKKQISKQVKKNILLYNILIWVCLGNALGCLVGFLRAEGDISLILISSITGVISLLLVYICNEKKKMFVRMLRD